MKKKIFEAFKRLPRTAQVIIVIVLLIIIADITVEVIQGCMEQRKRALRDGALGGSALSKNKDAEDEYDEADAPDDSYDMDYESGYEDPDTGISYYSVGDTIYLKQGDGELTLIFTEWGNSISAFGNKCIYAQYEIENTGNTDVHAGNGLFSVYADDYAVDQIYYDDGIHGEVASASTIAPGRMIKGTVYAEMNPDNSSTIDIMVGDVVVRLKDY